MLIITTITFGSLVIMFAKSASFAKEGWQNPPKIIIQKQEIPI